jgi:hypothetical protein
MKSRRVGTDGSSSDVIAYQWSKSTHNVYTVSATYNPNDPNSPLPIYTSEETQTGAQARVGPVAMTSITNADQGAMFSWRLADLANEQYCADTKVTYGFIWDINLPVAPVSTCITGAALPSEDHLTAMNESGGISDVVWQDAVAGQNTAVQPVLQLADGSYVGGVQQNTSLTPTMVAFDASGNVKWTVPGYNPDIATADGGIIADTGGSYYGNLYAPGPTSTFDATGLATGQNPSFENLIDWPGNRYYALAGTSVAANTGTATDFAPTYAATLGGNQSENGTSIWEVISPTVPSTPLQKQLPPQNFPLNSNYNSIELLTTASPDTIFTEYLATFAGAGLPPNNINGQIINDQVDLIRNPPPPVTTTGQNITFELKSWLSYSNPLQPFGCGPLNLPCPPLQGPFTVQTERFDTSVDTISVVTMTGHPLEGWRYWRVFSIGTNDLVVETGAVDTYAGASNMYSPLLHPLNFSGYYIFHNKQLKIWEEDLRYILKAVQTNDDSGARQGTNLQWNVVKGAWNPPSPSQNYILYNVCQSMSCN